MSPRELAAHELLEWLEPDRRHAPALTKRDVDNATVANRSSATSHHDAVGEFPPYTLEDYDAELDERRGMRDF